MIPYGMMQIYFFVPACTEKGVWGYAPTSKVQRTFVTGYPVALLAAP